MYVLCCGMRRAASTLQYQIAKELVELSGTGRGYGWCPNKQSLPKPEDHHQVIKCHAFIDVPGICIYIHRDIRDVAVSIMNMWGFDFDRVLKEELPAVLREKEQWMPRAHLICKYEDVIQNGIYPMCEQIAHLLDIDNIDLSEISEKFTLENQLEKLSSISWGDGFKGKLVDTVVDKDSLLHKNHIHNGAIGQWKQLPQSQMETLNNWVKRIENN